MPKFVVTVASTSSVEIEAEDEADAHRLLDQKLIDGDADVMVEILEQSSGWDITDIASLDD